jgi:hypothetical protein
MATSNDIFLQLGDIIQIDSPTNNDFNQRIFIIDYIDKHKFKIIDEGALSTYVLNITDEGNLSDESILSISILNRPEAKGYAKQNDLLPETWIDIYFGGDIPTTITGQITNLEEDMIEIEILNESGDTIRSSDKKGEEEETGEKGEKGEKRKAMDIDATSTKELIYIDFGYKGIPDNIPIDKIVIRNAPDMSVKVATLLRDDMEQRDWVGKEDGEIYEPERYGNDVETTIQIPTETVRAQIKDIILEADQIQFGPELESITQIVEVPEEQKRYGIETQTNELLDDLLASIPNANRTRSVLNNIHIMIERFKQLRTTFSTFDQNGNANMPLFKGANYKPLVEKISKFNYKLAWILPVAQNIKKMYDLTIDEENVVSDVLPLTLAQTRINEYDVRELYSTNADNYSTYMNKLQPYLTPTDPVYNNNTNTLTVTTVLDNFDTVIDNLDRFYSSIAKNDNIKRKRFLISRYNLGLSKLQTTELTSSKMKVKVVPMTNNDTISVKSILTLQEPVMYFSNISLPSTNIYDKSALNQNFLNYWQLFREKTAVTTKYVDNLNTSVDFDDKNYLKHKTEYLLSDDNNDPDKFNKFLDIIIPKTRVLFNLIKKHINGKLTLVSVINYLQPFLIYLDDISFKQYEEIKDFVEVKIRDYKKKYATNKEIFSKLSGLRDSFLYESVFYKLLTGRNDIAKLVLHEYGLGTNGKLYEGTIPQSNVLTNAELTKFMNNIDYTQLFHTSLSVLNIDLFTPFDFDDLLEEKNESFQVELEKKKQENECAQYVLTKRYISLEDLNADNNMPAYFDKKYDPTIYDILNEYKSERNEMDDVAFKGFLIDQLVKNIGLKRPDAKYEAVSMINKQREVQDGHYAVLEVDNIDEVKYYYYKRENNNWVRDEQIPENSFFGSNELFCNIQNKCIQINKTCADPALGNDLVKKDLIREMYEEFDSNYVEGVDKYKSKLDSLFKFQLERISKLKNINNYLVYKYERDKLSMAIGIEETDVIVSPHLKILDTILGQSDMVKKQNDIVRFVNKYTRQPVVNNSEDEYWLYCIDTNTKILPMFVFKLASVFIENGDYLEAITTIKNDQGVDVDNKTVDKHSGWEIEKIALSSEEGYETSGFKMQTKAILEKDSGTAIFQTGTGETQSNTKRELLANPKGKIINNVITSISNYMGVSLDSQRDAIIQHTLVALEETVDNQDDYEAKLARRVKEGGKKMPSYIDVFNKSLLTFTLAYISIYISVSIPSITSKKTFPGCKRSLIGYPITGDEDLTNIQYIACTAAGIKTNIYPWKALPKSGDKIAAAIKNTIDAYILKQGEINMLVEEKKNYLLQNEDDFIPVELDIKNWINFLPPLQDITNKTPSNLDASFRNSLLENLKVGSKDQFEQLRTIRSKMIYFSMSMIQSVQNVVGKEKLLLTNANKVPFLQNACCNTGEYKTIDYFSKREPSIAANNNIVSYLYNINFDMVNMAQPTLLVDPKDTKMKFPPVSNEFSEDTIYRGFIEYCNFNSDIPINSKLMSVCLNKPDDYDKNESLKENIRILKKEGKMYSIESFNDLLNNVNKLNIVPLDLVHTYPSNISHIRDLIVHMLDTSNPIGEDFLVKMKNLLDSYDIKDSDGNSDVRDLKNLLGKRIQVLETNINDYIRSFADITIHEKDKLANFIATIMDFNSNGDAYFVNNDDDTMYRSIQFMKNAIFNLINVFPNIIINRVNYSEIKIPTHWKLSKEHNNDIKNVIKEFYEGLKKFYQDDTINSVLKQNESELQDFFKLVDYTNLYANIISVNGDEISSILDNKTSYQLFRFYFLYTINNLLETVDRNNDVPKSKVGNTGDFNSDDDLIITSVQVEEEAMGEITEIDIVRGDQKKRKEKIANIVVAMLNIVRKEKTMINLNSQMVKEKINRSKDKERHKITSTLRDMSKEEREIENLFKNHRLERWGKGLQKGLTQYVAKTYDEERMDREREQIIEQQLNNRELLGEAFTADREIAMLEQEEGDIVSERIENDAFTMRDIPDDDDAGDMDDEGWLQYDDNE